MNRLKELLQERAKLVEENRKVLDKAQCEKRGLNTEEDAEYKKRDERIDQLCDLVSKEERLSAIEKSLPEIPSDNPPEQRKIEKKVGPHASDEYRKQFGVYLRGGMSEVTPEFRALQAESDVVGGYTVAPQQFVNELIKFTDDTVAIRQFATKIPVGQAASLGVPTLETDPDDADWTSELNTGNEDSAMAFGKRELHPKAVAKRIKVSNKLLRVSVLDVEGLVRGRLGYKLAVTEEKAFLTGSGAGQPLGMFTASTDGISTGRDVSTDNTTTAITADGLISALYHLKPQYQGRARWAFHRDAIRNIRKLKTGDGQYLWQPGLQGGQPSTILDKPYIQSEFVPNTFTTGLYVGIVGDFSFYWIADALGMQVQRLVELYATNNQVGFILRAELDGMPVLEEAFARVKLA